MIKVNNLITEGVKDDAIAVAKKAKKDKSPEFQKLMTLLDKDRGLMVIFTKWLLGIPTGPKEPNKPFIGGQHPGKSGGGHIKHLIPRSEEEIEYLQHDIEMPRMHQMFARVRPVPIQELEHLFDRAKEFGLSNFKKNFNEFKNTEEFGDYITKESGDKKVKDALGMAIYDGNKKGYVGIPYQIKKMIMETPKLYNLFRNNLDKAETLADFVARKGMRSDNPKDYESKVTAKQLFDAITNKLEELEDFSKESTLDKIKKFKLKAYPVEGIPADYILLMYIDDVTACANLGSQEWCIAQAEGYGGKSWNGVGEMKATSKENINKPKKATSGAVGHFNNTYQLSKYKKCYILYDFSRSPGDLMRKICFIVDPGGEIYGGWDAADTQLGTGKQTEAVIHKNFPELDM